MADIGETPGNASAMILPANHPQRIELNDEAHARPPEALEAPARVSYLALFSPWALRDQQRDQVSELARSYGVAPPAPNAIHYSADMGPFRLKWERHSEFARYKFIVHGGGDDPFSEPAIGVAPADWVAALPGEKIVATNAAVIAAPVGPPDIDDIAERYFNGNSLVGSVVSSAAALAVTDLRIRPDGFSRLLVFDNGLRPRQAGRLLQRLLEIDTYRLMALLALPIARQLGPLLTNGERELADIATTLAQATAANEPELLQRLTQLEAEIESRLSDNHFRFSAAQAYYRLVQQRIVELREERIPSLQTFQEFTERRLAPAMDTCKAAASRQETLSSRVSQASQLLSTRVAITREHQELAVLQSMNRRGDLQLRLQQTVEGLSVAAVSYYIVGLIGYAAKGVKAAGVHLDADLTMGLSIPIVVVAVALAMRKLRKSLTHPDVGASDS